MLLRPILIILSFIPFVILQYEKPVAEKVWRQRCTRNALVLNDCNWCRCSANFRYVCDARVCNFVDMFGHFKDSIQDLKVGMEIRGSWRTEATACEPGVHYQLGETLCVCNLDGSWPNPTCRDTFQVLHPVEHVKNFKASRKQKCDPNSAYLVDCNVCICPPNGRVDPDKCTQRNCSLDRELLSYKTLRTESTEVEEVYAQCREDSNYKLGCRNCRCLRNSRLLCSKCNDLEQSYCQNRPIGESFWIDCNICHCTENGMVFCTIYQCSDNEAVKALTSSSIKYRTALKPSTDIDCKPGTKYKKGCNLCYCFQTRVYGSNSIKKFACTVDECAGDSTQVQCEVGDKFEKPCLLCRCVMMKGVKMEVCETDPLCGHDKTKRDDLKLPSSSKEVVTFRAKCNSGHNYEKDCTSCLCSPDGTTLTCVIGDCKKPISMEVIPVDQNLPDCPLGKVYKIDCNYCVCLPNTDAICTTNDCNLINK